MSGLSAEALAQLEGLGLQEAREGLNFVSVVGARESLGADLSAEELSGLRSWDLSGVMARLNGLTFEAVHPDLTQTPVPAPAEAAAPIPAVDEELPEWLQPAEPGVSAPAEQAPPVEEPEPAPQEQWGGDSPPPAAAEAEEAAAGSAVAASVGGAGGRMREFFRSKAGQKTLVGVEFAASTALGFIIADILRLGPGQEAAIAFTAQSALGLTRLGTEFGARTVEGVEVRFPKFADLSKRLAGEKGLAGVLRNIRDAATRLQYDPIVSGLTIGIIGHSFYEALSGRPSIVPDTRAAEPTPGPVAVINTETPTATTTETPTGTSTPDATSTPTSTPTAAPTETPASSPTPIPDGGGEIGVGGQPPVEQVGPQHPGVGRLPGGETATIPTEDLATQLGDAELIAAQQTEAALTPQQLAGSELAGGTVWGHEEAFVEGLKNITHPNVATNVLKNLAYGLEQGQPFTQIGPTDIVNLVNPDVGAKIAEAASNIVGRDPSTLSGVDKLLWELGILGEHATKAMAETVIKAFANK